MQPQRFVRIFKFPYFVFFLCLLITNDLISQTKNSYPSFPFPMDIHPKLTGNFGEIRYNHFHSGIDISTFNKTGIPVHSVASGFVSRIRISPFGYGRAVYIDHPDGFTSVYAHLSAFNPVLEKYIHSMQVHLHTYEVDIYPEAGSFPVNKGEIIAYSGNSGSSSGPHLHFELRETKSEFPVNPLLFHLPVKDISPPKASTIYFYHTNALWRGAIKTATLLPDTKTVSYKTKTIINLPEGNMAIGLAAFDQLYPGGNHNGIYEIILDTNHQEAYHFIMNRFSFDDNYFVNAHIDYKQRLISGKKIILCLRQPGDMAPYYPNENINGMLRIKAGRNLNIRICLKDIAGNKSYISFTIHGEDAINKKLSDKLARYDKPIQFNDNRIKVNIPALALYSDAPIAFKQMVKPKEALSEAYRIGSYYIPVQHYFDIVFKNPNIPDSLKDKTLLIRIDHKNRRIASLGKWLNEDFYASSRAFGTFYLAYDRKAPIIKPLTNGQGPVYRFKLSDNLAGVHSYEGLLDGRWILVEYSGRSHILSCKIDSLTDDKEHILKIIVKDYVGNQNVYQQSIKNYKK